MAPRVLLLLSGGIDSPVAGHLLQRVGAELEAVHFSMEPITDGAPEAKSLAALRELGVGRLHVVPAAEAFGALASQCEHRFYFVLQKRFMLRTAARLARDLGCEALATGESLGQVSSQTLRNLHVIDAAVDVPVLRPLVGLDKVDIVDLARAIGTFDVSVGPEVCDVLGPDHPATHARLDAVEAEEDRVDLAALADAALAGLRVEPATDGAEERRDPAGLPLA